MAIGNSPHIGILASYGNYTTTPLGYSASLTATVGNVSFLMILEDPIIKKIICILLVSRMKNMDYGFLNSLEIF